MTCFNGAVRISFSTLATLALLFVAATLALPQSVEAQCVGCMYTGTSEPGDGQPGGGLDCVDQPEGMTDCRAGSYKDFDTNEWIDWCETGGSLCQGLMFLDFSEDGVARWNRDTARGSEELDAVVSQTCDGILLDHVWRSEGELSRAVAPLALAL